MGETQGISGQCASFSLNNAGVFRCLRNFSFSFLFMQGKIRPWEGDLEVPDRLMVKEPEAPQGAIVSERHLKVCSI